MERSPARNSRQRIAESPQPGLIGRLTKGFSQRINRFFEWKDTDWTEKPWAKWKNGSDNWPRW